MLKKGCASALGRAASPALSVASVWAIEAILVFPESTFFSPHALPPEPPQRHNHHFH
jgi:hypothetical protein